MVPAVIETLKTLYGRPEVIIHIILQKVRAEPAPNADKLETFNPSLLQELVEKLPAQNKLTWAYHATTIQEATLSTFGSWLYDKQQQLKMVITVGIGINSPSHQTNT